MLAVLRSYNRASDGSRHKKPDGYEDLADGRYLRFFRPQVFLSIGPNQLGVLWDFPLLKNSPAFLSMKLMGEFKVNLRLTDEAKQHISELKARSDLENPILGISWGRWNHETEDHWFIGLFDRDGCAGWLCKAPEFEFVIINPDLVERLNDRVLDIRGSTTAIH